MSQLKDQSEFAKDAAKMRENNEKPSKLKMLWKVGKTMGKMILKTILGKILKVIDILAQKLQNFSDKASDKIHDWLGMKKNE